jgi:hypothetical protein
VVAAAVVVVVVVRLLLAGEPAGGDEAGFLMVGDGWHHGSSLYGDYWVDRPPLLIGLMQLAGDLAGLRVLGGAAAVLTVLGVARAAQLAAGDRAAAWAAAAAAVLGSAHWFGVARVNGETLAGPFVAWSLALTLQALSGSRRGRQVVAAAAAGSAAACSVLVKQSLADGVVFAAVLLVVVAIQRPAARRGAVRVAAWGVTGALVTAAAVLVLAAARGTGMGALFDAVVSFRAAAGEVIRLSASDTTLDRMLLMLATWAASGLAIIAVLTAWHAVRSREPVVVATLATLVFGSTVALLGGSYWAHYLLQLVPASALAVGLLATRVRPRVRAGLAAAVVALTVGNLVWALTSVTSDGTDARTVGRWMAASGEPGDTAVVAYGQPNVLWNAGMSSPYPYLWSLPVRTRDPDLAELTRVLESPDAPTWVVDWSTLDTWGVDSSRLLPVLGKRYHQVAWVCGRSVWLADDAPRDLAPVEPCR